MRHLSFVLVLTGLFIFGCEPREKPPATAPVTAAPEEATSRAQIQSLREQVVALDAEAEAATRELVEVKVERDVLKRELNELRRRPGCAP